MKKNIIIKPYEFSIQPHQIDTYKQFSDAFGHLLTEISAWWIVRFLTKRNMSWNPFSYKEIDSFYTYDNRFTFGHLIEPESIITNNIRRSLGYVNSATLVGGGWIVQKKDSFYYITDDFVMRCYNSSIS